MKYKHLIIVYVLLLSSCGRKSNEQDSSSSKNTSTYKSDSLINLLHDLNLTSHFTIDSMIGYSLHFLKSGDIEVFKDSNEILTASIYMIRNYNLPEAREFDSVDVVRGNIFVQALNGPEIEEPDDCNTKYSIDSLCEYHNKNDTRCFFIRIKGIEFCNGIVHDTSYYHGYYVDVSYGKIFKFIRIPSDLIYLDNKKVTEISEMMANNIKKQP